MADTTKIVETERISRGEFDALEGLEWGEQNFGSLLTSRVHPRRDMMKLIARGWATSLGDVVVCDGDGFSLQPERYREGFVMSPQGRLVLARARERLAQNGYPKECSRVRGRNA